MTSICSLVESVGDSPVVPTGTIPSAPPEGMDLLRRSLSHRVRKSLMLPDEVLQYCDRRSKKVSR